MSRIERLTPVALSSLPRPGVSDRHSVQDIHATSDIKGIEEYGLHVKYDKLEKMMARAAVTELELVGEFYGQNMTVYKGHNTHTVTASIAQGISTTPAKGIQLLDSYKTRTLRLEFQDFFTIAHTHRALEQAELGIFSTKKRREAAMQASVSGVLGAYISQAIIDGLRWAHDQRYENPLASERLVGMGSTANDMLHPLSSRSSAHIPVVFGYKDMSDGDTPLLEQQAYTAFVRSVIKDMQRMIYESPEHGASGDVQK